MAFWDDIDWDFGGAGDDDNFWGKLWDQDRMDDAWKGFFKEGGWKDWKSYVNPGGIVANPAGQIADPGNFFTAEEHENWLNGTGPSDRTLMSGLVAGAAYGGGALLSGMGGAASGGSAGAANAGAEGFIGLGGAGGSGLSGGAAGYSPTTFASTASDYLGKAQNGLDDYEGYQPQATEVKQPAQTKMPSGGLQYPSIEQSLEETQPSGMQAAGMSDEAMVEKFQKALDQGDYKSMSAERKKLYEMVGKYQK